jgi:hypothetical protein
VLFVHGDALLNNCFAYNTDGPSTGRVKRNTQLEHPKAAQRRATANMYSPKEAGGINAEDRLPHLVTDPKPPRFTLQRVKTAMLTPTKPVGPAPGFFTSLLAVAKSSCMRVFYDVHADIGTEVHPYRAQPYARVYPSFRMYSASLDHYLTDELLVGTAFCIT